MALSGDLKDFGLLQLLTLIQVTRKTGCLNVQRATQSAAVYFEDGLLIKVKGPESRPETLALALYEAGEIEQDQYELLNGQSVPSEKAVALILEDMAGLPRDAVVDFVRKRSVADLYTLLTWPDGAFRLDVGVSPPEDDIVATAGLTEVLEKGRAYIEEWQMLVSRMPDLKWPVRLLSRPKQDFDELTLSKAEWRLVVSLTREVPLADIQQQLKLDDFAVRQLAYKLVSTGLAEVVELPAEEAPAAEPEPVAVVRDAREQKSESGGLGRFFGRKR